MKHISFPAIKLVASALILSCLAASPSIAHEWMAPKDAAAIKNPISADQKSVARGKELFLDNCADCHGDNAQGLKAAEVGLKKNPPNLSKRLNNHSDGDFFWKIQHGKDEMPAFKDSLKDDEIWDIINFIKNH